MNQIEKLRFREKLGFGVFAGGYNLIYLFKASYYLFFLTDVLGIGIKAAGALVAAGAVWDAVNDPIIGYFTVNHTNKKGEHIRYSLLYFALPIVICFALLFTNFHVSDTMTMIIAAAAFFLYDTLFTFFGVGYSTMCIVATDDQQDRVSINLFKSIGSNVGTIIGTLACFPLLSAFGALDADGNLIPETADKGFFFVALIFGVLAMLSALFHYFTTKERIKPHNEEQHIGFMEMLKILFTYKQFVLCTVQVMAYNVALLVMQTVVAYYATYISGSTAMSTTYLAAYIIGMIVASVLIVKPIDNKIGHKKTMVLGALLFVIAKIPFIIVPTSSTFALINFGLSGIGAALIYVTVFVYYSNVGDLVEWKCGKRLDACLGTVSGFVMVIASAIATQIITLSMDSSGFNSALEQQPDAVISTINMMLGVIPMVVSVLMLVVSYFINIDAEMEEMKASMQ